MIKALICGFCLQLTNLGFVSKQKPLSSCVRKHLLRKIKNMTPTTNYSDLAVNKSRIDHSQTSLRVIFGVIASLALLGNALVCAVILRSRAMLKNSYNLMILALAFTDLSTGKSIAAV